MQFMRHTTAKWLVGIVIVIVGLNLILKTAGFGFNLFFNGWWTLPLIIIGVASMINSALTPWNFAMVVLGFWLLANQRSWIPSWLNSSYIIGAAIIGFGLLFIFNPYNQTTNEQQKDEKRTDHHKKPFSEHARKDDATSPNYTAIFSGQEIKSIPSQLDGATLLAFFGGLSIDFRDAIINQDIIIDATALFGGLEIKFPTNVNVEVKSTPLFGGVENNIKSSANVNKPTVTVRSLAVFGGIEIS